jgi:hypothetical protein
MLTVDTEAWLDGVSTRGVPGLRAHCHEWLDLEDIMDVARSLAGLCAARGDMFAAPLERLSAIAGVRTRGRVQEAIKALEAERWIRIYRPDARGERRQPNVYTLVTPPP